MKAMAGGQNRTGIGLAPALAEQMLAATTEFPPSSAGSAQDMADVRGEYARGAEPMGTMPPPAGVAQLAKTALRAVTGGKPIVLLDKLGERAAFERAGVRLYDALVSKHDAGLTFRGGPSRADLAHLREEEHQHFRLVTDAIRELGGDPTAVTPSANLQATASKGIPAVLADPRTTVLQCLDAMLTAELVDNDCWAALIDLADINGERALVERFKKARETEREHLERVRTWLAAGTGRSEERARTAGKEVERKPMAAAKRRSSARGSSRRRQSPGARRRRSR